MRALLPLSLVFFIGVGGPLYAAECAYPDSDRGQGPDWLCGAEQFEGAGYLAVGSKSRMPSISLQNRLAAKEAMSAVVIKLLIAATATLQAEMPGKIVLQAPTSVPWSTVARFKGITVLDKVVSPQRHLYVLAGVKPELQGNMLITARREILVANKAQITAALGPSEWRKLNAPLVKSMTDSAQETNR